MTDNPLPKYRVELWFFFFPKEINYTLRRQCIDQGRQNRRARDLAGALDAALYWADTKQGRYFWETWYKRLQEQNIYSTIKICLP